MMFEALALCEPLLRSLKAAGYQEPTPIQQKAIPQLLAGRDLIGCAQTGTGKTAAFVLPTIQRLITTSSPATGASRRRQRNGRRAIRALILTPTRELAAQIDDSLASYGQHTDVRHIAIFGGVSQRPQVSALKTGIDVLVATPGRLLDLIEQGFIDLSAVEVLILDEADQMLDMGFIHDLRKIVARVPERRQTLMFSATMPTQIRELAKRWLQRPHEVKVTPVASTPERVLQSVCFVDRHQKPVTLTRFLHDQRPSRTLVFARTKRGADKVARGLERDGIRAIAIHGNKSQSRRQAAIREFNSKRPPVLVATDLAARGLDFSDVSHVINYDMPDTPEAYVHRIGRTARAGTSGRAVSFCERDDRSCLRTIEKLTKQTVSVEQLPGTAAKRTPRLTETDDGQQEKGDAQKPITSKARQNNVTARQPRRRTSRNRLQTATTNSKSQFKKSASTAAHGKSENCLAEEANLRVLGHTQNWRIEMPQGTIKKLIAEKGFGFINGQQGEIFFRKRPAEAFLARELAWEGAKVLSHFTGG